MRALVVVLMVACGCLPHPRVPLGIADTYRESAVTNHTDYSRSEVKVTRRTPGGVAVDDPLVQLSDTQIDNAFVEVELCLQTMPARWTTWETWIMNGNCSRASVPRTIDRRGVLVKVAPDWYTSKCSGRQAFPCKGDDVKAGCAAKGLTPTPECPCACGRAVQWDFVVVTTPNLAMLKVGVIELVTGCENPWAIPLVRCL